MKIKFESSLKSAGGENTEIFLSKNIEKDNSSAFEVYRRLNSNE